MTVNYGFVAKHVVNKKNCEKILKILCLKNFVWFIFVFGCKQRKLQSDNDLRDICHRFNYICIVGIWTIFNDL